MTMIAAWGATIGAMFGFAWWATAAKALSRHLTLMLTAIGAVVTGALIVVAQTQPEIAATGEGPPAPLPATLAIIATLAASAAAIRLTSEPARRSLQAPCVAIIVGIGLAALLWPTRIVELGYAGGGMVAAGAFAIGVTRELRGRLAVSGGLAAISVWAATAVSLAAR